MEHGTRPPSYDLVEVAAHNLRNQNIQQIFDAGLHEFIVAFIANNQRIAEAISADYRFVG